MRHAVSRAKTEVQECKDARNGFNQVSVLLDVANSPQLLDAHSCFHCTEPWDGSRVVLIGFSVECPALPTRRFSSCCSGFVLVPAPSEENRLDPKPAFPLSPPRGFIDPGSSSQVPTGLNSEVQDQVRSVATPLLSSASTSSQARSACGSQLLDAHVISSEEERKRSSLLMRPLIRSPAGALGRRLNAGTAQVRGSWWTDSVCALLVGGGLFKRGRLCSGSELQHALSVQDALRAFVTTELGDLRKAAFTLASGHLKVSPFSESSLGRLSGARLARNRRTSWATGSSQGMAKCSPPKGSRVTPVT